MNDRLTRKKHSLRIADLALEKGIIDKKLYDSLYFESYEIQRKPKRRNRHGYKFYRYYTELYWCSFDYWGECSEHGLIDYVWEIIFWTFSQIEAETGEIIKPFKISSTLKLIKFLKSIPDKGWEEYHKKYYKNIDCII